MAHKIIFDDGGYGGENEVDTNKLSLNDQFGDEDAWDDTEILQIFDAAVRSHTTKGQLNKNKNRKQSSSKEAQGLKKSRLNGEQNKEYNTNDAGANNANNSRQDSSVPSKKKPISEEHPSQPSFSGATNFGYPMPPFCQPWQQQHPLQENYSMNQNPSLNGPEPTSQVNYDYLTSLSSKELESALSDMLMAWYQSGYATGRYYTLMEQQQKIQRRQSQWWSEQSHNGGDTEPQQCGNSQIV